VVDFNLALFSVHLRM